MNAKHPLSILPLFKGISLKTSNYYNTFSFLTIKNYKQ